MSIRALITEYESLQNLLIGAGKRLWELHDFLRCNGAAITYSFDGDEPDLAEVYLKLDGWKHHPNKPDVWVP